MKNKVKKISTFMLKNGLSSAFSGLLEQLWGIHQEKTLITF
jgi:hypothetical protein